MPTCILLSILENIQCSKSFNGVIIISWSTHRSSHRRSSIGKRFLKNFAKFTTKHLLLRPSTLLKKRPWCRRCQMTKFLRTHFLQTTFIWTDHLTHFMISGFLMFSGVIKRGQRHDMS